MVDEDNAAFFPTLSERTLTGRANLTQSIFSDRIWADFSIEKHLQEARVGELSKVRLDVGLDAATAYLEVLRTLTRLMVQRQNLTFSRTNLERAQIRVSAGEASRSELYRWESKIAVEQTQVLAAAVIRREAEIELNRVLDRPLEAPLELVDTTLDEQYRGLIDPRIDRYTRDPRSLEVLRNFLVQKGLAGSPELKKFDASILAGHRTSGSPARLVTCSPAAGRAPASPTPSRPATRPGMWACSCRCRSSRVAPGLPRLGARPTKYTA